jgi:cation diffusion facilitator family transporter
MHTRPLDQWQHDHDFVLDTAESERKTRLVVLLTACMMFIEIIAGYLFGSIALLADGWHMATHVAALSIAVFAYRYARRHTNNPKYSFGTGKVGSLGGFASAIALAVVALMMAIESVERLVNPQTIRFNEAILVAFVGLAINLISAWLLHAGHEHHHHDEHGHHHTHHDHNLKAAYFHVLADALTSLLAIVALFTGKYFGWIWMDALMGLVGAALITRWGYGLLLETSAVLLDAVPKNTQTDAIREAIEADADSRITDLHIWQLGPHHQGAIICLVTPSPKKPQYYKSLLTRFEQLKHITIEVTTTPAAPHT